MKTSRKVTIYTCDGCDKEVVQVDEGEDVYGFFGTAMQIHEAGGIGGLDWFACKEACIRKAVTNAIQREYEKN
jgi:hypothetical protein